LVIRAEEHQLPLQQVAVAPSQIVTAAIRAARPSYDSKGVRLTARLADDLPELTADPERLTQVVDGLLSNALRHTPAGGQVTVTTRAAWPHVQIAVADTGEGIAAEHLPHIFERFYGADPARDRAHGGSGIGLTIAHALITAQGGASPPPATAQEQAPNSRSACRSPPATDEPCRTAWGVTPVRATATPAPGTAITRRRRSARCSAGQLGLQT
jgi:K+-sensing histidine kinase KdpD